MARAGICNFIYGFVIFCLTTVIHLLYSIAIPLWAEKQVLPGGSEMSTRRLLSLAVLCSLSIALLVTTQAAWSQEVTATIVGTITDQSGAPIKGAAVTATDADRGTVWNATTNDSGSYNLPRLPVGSYSVKVSASGFDTAVHPPFTLVLNQTARIDVQMRVGQVTTSVEVTGAAPILQTDTTQI